MSGNGFAQPVEHEWDGAPQPVVALAPEVRRGRPRSPRVDQAILDAAIELFVEEGYPKVTFERIAARAGVGKPAIYRRYRTKLDLLLAAVEGAARREISYPDTGDTERDLRAMATAFVSSLVGTPVGRLTPVMIAEGNRTPEVAEEYHRFIARERVEQTRVVQRCVERGDLRDDVDLDRMTEFLAGQILYRFVISGSPLDAEYVDSLVGLMLETFGRRPC
jgi:AcrR family transcriptional regulator